MTTQGKGKRRKVETRIVWPGPDGWRQFDGSVGLATTLPKWVSQTMPYTEVQTTVQRIDVEMMSANAGAVRVRLNARALYSRDGGRLIDRVREMSAHWRAQGFTSCEIIMPPSFREETFSVYFNYRGSHGAFTTAAFRCVVRMLTDFGIDPTNLYPPDIVQETLIWARRPLGANFGWVRPGEYLWNRFRAAEHPKGVAV